MGKFQVQCPITSQGQAWNFQSRNSGMGW